MKRSYPRIAELTRGGLLTLSPLLVAAAACSAGGGQPAVKPTGAAASAPPSSTAGAGAPAAKPGEAGASAPKSPFHVIAQTQHELVLTPVDGGLVVHGAPVISEIKDDLMVRDERYTNGLPTFGAIVDIVGKWPTSARMTYIASNGRVGWGELYEWKSPGWQPVGAKLASPWVYLGMSAWSQGRHLALLYKTMPYGAGPSVKIKVLSGTPAAPLPELTKSTGKDEYRECSTLVDPPSAFLARPEGHVFLFGVSCPDGDPIVEWWSPGSQTSKTQKIPLDLRFNEFAHFAARSPTDVYLAHTSGSDDPLMVHFDGSTWTPVERPPTKRTSVRSTSIAKDGTLWVVTANNFTGLPEKPETIAGEVWKRPPGGAWENVPLPATYPFPINKELARRGAMAVHADDSGDVWVVADGAVLRTRPSKHGPQKVDWELSQQFAGTFKLPKAATKECESLFALFYGFTKVTPDDYDFPLTRKALKGQTQFDKARFVVTRENGQKYFGAFVPSYDLGKKMVDRVRNEVEGSSPQLLCARPEVVRELKLDLMSGEVLR